MSDARLHLLPLNGGPEFRLPEGDSVLGSGAACQAVIPHPSVSERHCRIQVRGQSIILQSLAAGSQVSVNGSPIQRTTVDLGDTIAIGELHYELRPAERTAPALPREIAALPIMPPRTTPRPPPSAAPAPLGSSLADEVEFSSLELIELPAPPPVRPANPTVKRALPRELSPKPDAPQGPIPKPRAVALDRELPAENLEPTRPSRFSGLGITPLQFAILAGCGLIIIATQVRWSRFSETSDLILCTELENFHEEIRQLRDRQAGVDEWDELSQRVQKATAPRLVELQRTATSLRPIRRRLLYLSRDHLPAMLTTARRAPSPAEETFEELLEEVRTLLAGELPPAMQTSEEEAAAGAP